MSSTTSATPSCTGSVGASRAGATRHVRRSDGPAPAPQEHTGPRPVAVEHFRPDDPDIQRDPYPYYPLLRQQRPVLRTDFQGQPCWVVSRRRDIQRILMNPQVFSSRTTPLPIMLFQDPPEHDRLRGMVSALFTAAAVTPLEPRIADRARSLLDPAVRRGWCDVVADFGAPLTVATIGLTLGISVEQVEELRAMTRLQQEFVLALRLGREPAPELRAANDGLVDFMAEIVAARRYSDTGVVSVLAQRCRAGELTPEECANFAVMLFVAGHSTTTNLIANCFYTLTRHPEHLARLRSDDGFVDPFLDEVLRTRPSFHRNIRVTTQDVVLHGESIPAGSVVRLLLASANRDAEFYADGEDFDPDRTRRQHFSFGRGIHTCLGSWLARLEARTALRVVAGTVGVITLDPARRSEALVGGTFNEFGFDALPVRLTDAATT